MNDLPSHVVIVTARRAVHNPAAALAAVQRQTDAPIFLVGRIAPTPGVVCLPADNPAQARNLAIRQTTAEIVCLIDADCIPAADWVRNLLAPFADPAVVGVKGVYATRQTAVVARFVQAEYADKYAQMAGRPTIDFIDTYSAAYRREVLVRNEAFDEQFPYLEDQELSFRLASRGYRMVFQPQAVVYRNHPTGLAPYAANKFWIGYWKAQVVRRHPAQTIADSHTPPVVKWQIVLAALGAVAPAAAAALRPALWPWTPAPWLLLLLTTLPFVARTRRRDAPAAAVAPLLLTARAVALGLGFAWGVLRPAAQSANTAAAIGGVNYALKRLLDLIGGLLGCLILLVALPWIALAIALDSGRPIFFRQQRIGRGGRPFTVYKFRSMRRDAEAQLDMLLDPQALQADPAFKLADDPRVTRVGRLLRRWSLDELPQFWNVLKGEMSLVGPRPEEARIVALYNDWHRRRLAVKPGLTGPMQVNGRGDLSLDERVRLEIDYIEQYALWRDLWIIWRTLPAVASGRGAR